MTRAESILLMISERDTMGAPSMDPYGVIQGAKNGEEWAKNYNNPKGKIARQAKYLHLRNMRRERDAKNAFAKLPREQRMAHIMKQPR